MPAAGAAWREPPGFRVSDGGLKLSGYSESEPGGTAGLRLSGLRLSVSC